MISRYRMIGVTRANERGPFDLRRARFSRDAREPTHSRTILGRVIRRDRCTLL